MSCPLTCPSTSLYTPSESPQLTSPLLPNLYVLDVSKPGPRHYFLSSLYDHSPRGVFYSVVLNIQLYGCHPCMSLPFFSSMDCRLILAMACLKQSLGSLIGIPHLIRVTWNSLFSPSNFIFLPFFSD